MPFSEGLDFRTISAGIVHRVIFDLKITCKFDWIRERTVRRAKILATLGPSTREPKIIEAMLAAGVDGVRINMSHGNYDEKAADILAARSAAEKMKRPLAVLVDLS